MKRILPAFIQSLPSEFNDFRVDKSTHDDIFKESLINSNHVLSQQIEKNKKKIKTLKSVLNFIQSLPSLISPETHPIIFSIPDITPNYDCEITIVNEIHKYICKSKYFPIEAELKILPNSSINYNEKIPIVAKVYTSESTPKEITQTMKGHKIIRGQDNTNLVYSPRTNKFNGKMKIQIREVSSHYINKTINLVIEQQGFCEYSVKPAVVKDINIKAKERTCQRLRAFK